MHTFDSLEVKTLDELRAICRFIGIGGMSKKRKEVVINTILDYYDEMGEGSGSVPGCTCEECAPGGPEDVSGVEESGIATLAANLRSFVHPGTRGAMTTLINVSCGASSKSFNNLEGKNVGQVSAFLKEVLNIDTMSKALVNGIEVEDNYTLRAGDNVEFLKPAGRKG